MNTWTIIATLITGMFFGFCLTAGGIYYLVHQEDIKIAAEVAQTKDAIDEAWATNPFN